jgi:hypothetical protein
LSEDHGEVVGMEKGLLGVMGLRIESGFGAARDLPGLTNFGNFPKIIRWICPRP